MKDLSGREIDFSDKTLFPPEYMVAKKNRKDEGDTTIKYDDRTTDEFAEITADFMLSLPDDI
jgi:hypothetical protein